MVLMKASLTPNKLIRSCKPEDLTIETTCPRRSILRCSLEELRSSISLQRSRESLKTETVCISSKKWMNNSSFSSKMGSLLKDSPSTRTTRRKRRAFFQTSWTVTFHMTSKRNSLRVSLSSQSTVLMIRTRVRLRTIRNLSNLVIWRRTQLLCLRMNF